MRRTLAAALVLFCAWTSIAQAHTTRGRVDSTAVRAPRRADTVFHTQRTRDITATLHWLNANASLRLFLARRTRSGTWVPVARVITRAHPKHLVLRSARPGRYRVRVRVTCSPRSSTSTCRTRPFRSLPWATVACALLPARLPHGCSG